MQALGIEKPIHHDASAIQPGVLIAPINHLTSISLQTSNLIINFDDRVVIFYHGFRNEISHPHESRQSSSCPILSRLKGRME